jgi:hypothetical protein
LVPYDNIAPLWSSACEDAGYVPGADAVLYIVPGESPTGNAAIHVEPGSSVGAVPGWPLEAGQIRDANSASRRPLHRVFVRDFSSPRVALGMLRHELEHARQFERSSAVYRAMSFARDGLAREFEVREPPSRDGSACLYNLLPAEEDANRAAARLTASVFGPPSEAELESTDGPLFRDQGPVDPDSLALRALIFMALFPDGVAWVAGMREEPLGDLLAHLGVDAPRAWEILAADPEPAAFGREALARCPAQVVVDAAARPPLAWAPVARQIELGRAAAEALFGSELPDPDLN